VMAGPGADDAHALAQQIARLAERRAVPEVLAHDQGAVADRFRGFPRRLQIGDDRQVELARQRVVLAEVARAHTYVQLPLAEREQVLVYRGRAAELDVEASLLEVATRLGDEERANARRGDGADLEIDHRARGQRRLAVARLARGGDGRQRTGGGRGIGR